MPHELTAAPHRPPARRWPWLLAAGMSCAAAVAAAVAIVRANDAPRAAGSIELPAERALEARFTGPRFAPYRPYRSLRGGSGSGGISLAALAQLEQRHELPDLVAALAATGNVVRATEIAGGLPYSAAAESDRAALALAAGDAEQALDHAYSAIALDPALATGWWNLGLAARQQHLIRVARNAFQQVAQRGEPGWADEARDEIAALERELAPELAYADFMKRATAMIAGGPIVSVEDVRRFPAFARVHVLDAIRVAPAPRLLELRPLARELDALSGTQTMTAMLDRAAADPALRARFADRYRAVLAGALGSDEVRELIADLRRAGPAVDDIRIGTIIAANQVDTYLDDVSKLATAWHDPWFELSAERVRIMISYPRTDLRAIPAYTAALAACTTDAWNLRCGQLAQKLAQKLFDIGRTREAEHWTRRALDWYQRGMTPTFIHIAQALLGDIHRHLGRSALARAELEEVTLATETTSCALRRHASIVLAAVHQERCELAAVRERLPEPVAPAGCETTFEVQALGTAVDLARLTGNADDIARAKQWIDAVGDPTDADRDGFALVGRVRLTRGEGRSASAELEAWLAAHPAVHADAWRAGTRSWAFTTLLADAGAQHDWAKVLELAATEHPGGARAECTVVFSLDDRRLTIAARTPDETIGVQKTLGARELDTASSTPASITSALARCRGIAVDARPPLHGRADLLPAELPWFFTGDAPPVAAPAKPWRAVEITSPRPPDSSLPPLPDPGPSSAHFDRSLAGADASPSHVLAAIADATYVEVHAHGIVSTAEDDAAFLALSPDADGTYTLHAATLRKTKLARAPIVVLAACRAAAVAAYYQTRWSLPDAFLAAGAHAVVAADVPIPDAEARGLFDELHRRIDAGEPVPDALAAIRSAAPAGSWQRHLIVFR